MIDSERLGRGSNSVARVDFLSVTTTSVSVSNLLEYVGIVSRAYSLILPILTNPKVTTILRRQSELLLNWKIRIQPIPVQT